MQIIRSDQVRRGPARPVRPQEAFSRVAPVVGAALVLGAGGGFVLAAALTLTRLAGIAPGAWWVALAQAHGHLQLYGWVGLFVLGVLFHFVPRLAGRPLAWPRCVPWLLAAQVSALLLRALSQPLAVVSGAGVWRGGLVVSGLLEVGALALGVALLARTVAGAALQSRPALWGVLPFFALAFASLLAASVVNVANGAAAAAATGLVPAPGDQLNVLLGLLGFLVPIALAMSARSLPMYAGLEAFPRRLLWPLAGTYAAGLALAVVGTAAPAAAWAGAVGLVLLGSALCTFVAIFGWMMSRRRRLPPRIAALAPEPAAAAQHQRNVVAQERATYGPFVALVGSAYAWATLGGVLLVLQGGNDLLGLGLPLTPDAARHSLAAGFLSLLLAGVAPRMLPGFSGGRIRSARLVTATLVLGTSAAVARVGGVLFAPLFAAFGPGGDAFATLLFGLSGPLGWAMAVCLTINLWPAIWPAPQAAER